jgi:pimeloyl-ACP methyl ester carboxylesterase
MPKNVEIFKTSEAREQYSAAYDKALKLWPIPYHELYIPTRFGLTHVIASGSEGATPLILLHPAGIPAIIWYRNVKLFSQYFRTYAVDVIGEVNKSVPIKPIQNRQELADWIIDLFKELKIDSAHMIGNSFGGFLTVNTAIYLPKMVEKIVLISPAATFVQMWAWYWYFFPAYLTGSKYLLRRAYDWIWHGFPIDDCIAQVRAITRVSGIPRHVPPSIFSDDELRKIKTPMLLLIGDREVIYKPEKAIQRATRLITNIETAIVKNANHNAEYTASEEVNRKVIDFLNKA